MKKKFSKITGITMQQWIANETRKRKVTFWAQSYIIKPVIHPTIFGDGMQLAYLATIDQRPHYWLIRIDSSIDLAADDFDYEKHLLGPLEEQFGRYPDAGCLSLQEFQQMKREGKWAVQDYGCYEQYEADCQYPRIYWGGGHWGSVVNFGTGKVG